MANLQLAGLAEKLGATVSENGLVFVGSGSRWGNNGEEMIYFVGGDAGCIKIGLSSRPHYRLTHLQVGSPIPLRILALCLGDRDIEKEYHHRFAASRSHGEWFHRTPELLAEIEWLTTPDDAPAPVTCSHAVDGGRHV